MSASIGLDQSRPTRQDWGGALLEAMTIHRKADKTGVNKGKSREWKVDINKNRICLTYIVVLSPKKKNLYQCMNTILFVCILVFFFNLFLSYFRLIKYL